MNTAQLLYLDSFFCPYIASSGALNDSALFVVTGVCKGGKITFWDVWHQRQRQYKANN